MSVDVCRKDIEEKTPIAARVLCLQGTYLI